MFNKECLFERNGIENIDIIIECASAITRNISFIHALFNCTIENKEIFSFDKTKATFKRQHQYVTFRHLATFNCSTNPWSRRIFQSHRSISKPHLNHFNIASKLQCHNYDLSFNFYSLSFFFYYFNHFKTRIQ